ncbi:putative quinol monooxygenase [Pseudomonas mucidolens]|uniref:Quinol monooxygenase YgiN n=1 Tax=Pseudomonas mucidolens TaxID=46679 RepID=A0A1H2NQZ7_9PSED|nr:putative quinol monooxygenase [Pseudomonas mucidolens]SDV07804.1 Quinol monooxygenase YgiN [Pseudomonas mucidolens]SQH31277.1 antibiotic biosynthesis monooxygenase [Pseudomonas mucidolens]
MSELFIVVGLKAKPGREDQLRRDLSDLVEPSRKEDGNISYGLFEDQKEPGFFVFVEEWSSTEARKKHHEHSPHIQNFHKDGVSNVDTTRFAHILKRVASTGTSN